MTLLVGGFGIAPLFGLKNTAS